MRDCLFTVYGDRGTTLVERRVVIPPLPERALLERLWRENIEGTACRFGLAREGRTVRALYLAEDLVPEAAIRVAGRRGRMGRWATTLATLGDGPDCRCFVGPELFFRQIDLGATEAWIVPLLLGFGEDVEVRQLKCGVDLVYEWEFRQDRYYYRGSVGRWAVYGAGNTPADRIDAWLEAEKPASADEFLWSVGAMRLDLAGRVRP